MADTRRDIHRDNGQGYDDIATPADRIRAGLITAAAVKAMRPPESIVDGILYRNTLAMLFGTSGAGKSFLALDISLHVASGSWWQRREVRQGSVLYVVAEGAGGFGRRIAAWEHHHGIHTDGLPIEWLPWAVNVYDPGWAGALAEVVHERRPMMVVLDTFARCATGAEENSARDIGKVVAHLDHIRRGAGSNVWLIHHSGKDTTAGARGSTALRGAMDTELELVGEAKRLHLYTRKQKDAPEASPIALGLVQVNGSQSVVVDRPPRLVEPLELPEGAAITLAALMDVDIAGGVSTTVWRAAAGATERTFYRHRKGLLEHGHVVNIGTEAMPRYRPAAAAKSLTESGDEM